MSEKLFHVRRINSCSKNYFISEKLFHVRKIFHVRKTISCPKSYLWLYVRLTVLQTYFLCNWIFFVIIILFFASFSLVILLSLNFPCFTGFSFSFHLISLLRSVLIFSNCRSINQLCWIGFSHCLICHM